VKAFETINQAADITKIKRVFHKHFPNKRFPHKASLKFSWFSPIFSRFIHKQNSPEIPMINEEKIQNMVCGLWRAWSTWWRIKVAASLGAAFCGGKISLVVFTPNTISPSVPFGGIHLWFPPSQKRADT
jgi:hypothetical protein